MLTLTIMDFDALTGGTDGRFSDFYGERGVFAALTAGERVVGLAAVEFTDGVIITKLRAEPPYDVTECRRFFIRSLVLKLLANRAPIRTRFCDELLAEIGFEDDGSGGMTCLAEKVVFKKICEV
ncbi:MAG: hypothetical protein LBT20_08220 [Clostridiales bacterium]|jgi:hypothetical protein|nr:hypothetical protein [Clostridiales bacterium]